MFKISRQEEQIAAFEEAARKSALTYSPETYKVKDLNGNNDTKIAPSKLRELLPDGELYQKTGSECMKSQKYCPDVLVYSTNDTEEDGNSYRTVEEQEDELDFLLKMPVTGQGTQIAETHKAKEMSVIFTKEDETTKPVRLQEEKNYNPNIRDLSASHERDDLNSNFGKKQAVNFTSDSKEPQLQRNTGKC